MNHKNIICLMDFLQFSQQNLVIQSWKHFKWVDFNELFQGFFYTFFLLFSSFNSSRLIYPNFFRLEVFLKLAKKAFFNFDFFFLYCTLRKTFIYSSSFYFSGFKIQSSWRKRTLLHSTTFSDRLRYFLHPKIWNTEKMYEKKIGLCLLLLLLLFEPRFRRFVLLTTLCFF